MIHTRKTLITVFVGSLILAGTLALGACNQNAIFFNIENEIALREAVIPGGPTKIVELGTHLYVASGGRVYEYGGGSWHSMGNQPPGSKVLDLAVAGSSLYALTSGSSGLDSAKVYQYITSWSEVSNGTGYILQSLHGANDRLFVGAYTTPGDKSVNRYAVLVVTGTALTLVRGPAADNQGELQAAAFFDSEYYISLAGQGIFHGTTEAALGAATALTDSAGNNFTALLPVGTTELIAVTSKCRIWKIPPGTTAVVERDYNVDFSGALALWDDGTNQLLLLGRTSSSGITTTSYTYGYWELPITGGALDIGASLAAPGNNTVTTVASNAKYNSSLGTHVITSLYQASSAIDSARPLFASTQQDGLWSSRFPLKEWNIE